MSRHALLRTPWHEPQSAYIAAVGALWAALAFSAIVIWIALSVRRAALVPPRELALGLAFDALLAIVVGCALYLLARRWAAAELAPRRVLARLAALSLGFFFLVHAIVLAVAVWRGAAIEQALPRLSRSWPSVAVDYSFFWAVAISVVPIPFLRSRGSVSPDVIEVRSTGRIEYVPVDAVLALTAAENYVELHLASRSVLHRATLAQMSRQLAATDFQRVHRCALVRRSAVVACHRGDRGRLEIELSNGRRIAVARAYRRSFRHAD